MRNLRVTFTDKDINALDGISFTLQKGSSLGIVGESGSGKSLTCKSILNLLAYKSNCRISGEIIYPLEGKGVNLLSEDKTIQENVRGRRIAYVAQEPMDSFNPIMTCGKQLEELLKLYGNLDKEDLISEQHKLFRMVGLSEPERILNSLPHQISGGQAQRVSIALALSGNPEIIICDEPTTALDPLTQNDIVETLHELQKDHGLSLLFVSHDLNLVAKLCEHIVVLRSGRVVEKGPKKTILTTPSHEYTSTLLQVQGVKNKYLSTANSSPDSNEQSDATINLHGVKEKDLVISDVSVSYAMDPWYKLGRKRKLQALKEINCAIQSGSITGVVGESGSGKSTLGRCIAGLQTWETGTIHLNGVQLSTDLFSRSAQLRKSVQIIFQDPSSALNPRMQIIDAVAEAVPETFVTKSGKSANERAAELLELVHLSEEMFSRKPGTLSGGQRQRVCIARSLAVEPDLLICDECVSSLDVVVQIEILDLLRHLHQTLGLQVIFISHDISAVSYLCDFLLVMNEGRVVEQGQTDHILRNPAHASTRLLVESMPTSIESL